MDTTQVLMLMMFSLLVDGISSSSCPTKALPAIRSDHLYLNQKHKPAIIAHRGNQKDFQENTFDGILSSVTDQDADGFEIDVHLTLDNKLVVHHDTNLLRMTGNDRLIQKLTYEQIRSYNLLTEVPTKTGTLKYNKERKIPLLEQILDETASMDKIHLIELKPDDVPAEDDDAMARSVLMAQMVADMIKKYKLEKKSIVISYDYLKVHAVHKHNSDIMVGSLFPDTLLKQDEAGVIRAKHQLVKQIPTLADCMNEAPNTGEGFSEFMHPTTESVQLFGVFGAVFVLPYSATGAVFSVDNTKDMNAMHEYYIPMIASTSLGLITDDVPRLIELLENHGIRQTNAELAVGLN